MFVLTLNKNAVKRLGALAVCGALLAGTVYGVSRYSQVQSAAALPEGAPSAIETTQDIAAFFSGYGLQVDLANTTVDKVKVPKKWDDSFSAFNEVVKASGLDLDGVKGKTVEKWVALCPGRSTGEETVSGGAAGIQAGAGGRLSAEPALRRGDRPDRPGGRHVRCGRRRVQ